MKIGSQQVVASSNRHKAQNTANNIYSKEIYNELGYQEGEKFLDSLNNRFDQMRDDLITWKEE